MAVAWLVVAAVVGVLIGRMIRERDRQVPPSPGSTPVAEGEKGRASRVAGRGKPRGHA